MCLCPPHPLPHSSVLNYVCLPTLREGGICHGAGGVSWSTRIPLDGGAWGLHDTHAPLCPFQ